MAVLFGADEILHIRPESETREKVILVGVRETAAKEHMSEDDFAHAMEELKELTRACDMDPLLTITQQLPLCDHALYVRAGAADELAFLVRDQEAERIVCNDTLSPMQMRNLQKILGVPVMDRTGLILEIFSRRAGSREARLQVELASLQYLKPRLIGMWETQNRQGGASGALSSKGEGEKQLEIDRRTIDHRLARLRRELKVVATERETQRKLRTDSHLPLVALVGYTNAGKSTIMNAMMGRWEASDSKEVFAADMPFATLDTSIRKIRVEQGREFLLSDTVGFIRALPTSLVEAFHSTLEEVTRADLLLQVVDGSDDHHPEHIQTTRETITALGAGHIPMVTIFNKSDLRGISGAYPRRGLRESSVAGETNENIYISAKDTDSIELLTQVILEKLEKGHVQRAYLIPYHRGDVLSFLAAHGRVLSREYREDGTALRVCCDPVIAKRAGKMLAR